MKSLADNIIIIKFSMPAVLIAVGLILTILSMLGILDPMFADIEIEGWIKASGLGTGLIILLVGAFLWSRVEVNRVKDSSGKVIIGYKKKIKEPLERRI